MSTSLDDLFGSQDTPHALLIVNRKATPYKSELRFALATLVASGAAALGHESLWTRRMADLLGANIESSMRVIGCFFLGLSLGAAVAIIVLPRVKRIWRTVGLVELGIGALSLPIVFLPDWTGTIWPLFGPKMLIQWQGTAAKWLLSVCTVVPPSFLVGMTLPLVTSAVSKKEGAVGPELLLYAAYTAGGVIGLTVVAVALLPGLGAKGAMGLMVLTNLTIGLACFRRDQQAAEEFPDPKEPVSTASPLPVSWFAAGISFSSGLGTVALQVLALQLVFLTTPLSLYPQITILLSVVLLLALASLIVIGILRGHPGLGRELMRFSLWLSSVMIVTVPFIFVALPVTQVGQLGYGVNFVIFFLKLVTVSALVLAPAFLAAGLVFPSLVSWVTRGADNRQTAKLFAGLLAANGLGGLVGAELAYFILLPRGGVHVAFGIVAVFYAVLAVLTSFYMAAAKRTRYLLSLSFVGVLSITAFASPRLPLFFGSGSERVLGVWSGSEGSLALVENQFLGRAMIFDSQYLLGSSGAKPDQERQTHIPLMLHREPRRVAFIGVGTGITAGASLLHDAVDSVTALELSPLVAKAACSMFGEFNHELCQNPKVTVLAEDARTFIAASRDEYDIIIGDLFIPWRPGEAGICTLEQFRAARRALAKGAVFCQWLPLHQLIPAQFEIIAATFQEVFPTVHLFRSSFKTQSLPVALVGFKDADLDWAVIQDRCNSSRTANKIGDPLPRHVEGLGMLYLGTVPLIEERGPSLNTLDNLRLELEASLVFISGHPDDYYAGTNKKWLDFLEVQLTRIASHDSIPLHIRSLPSVGFLASRVEVAAQLGHDRTEILHAELRNRVPKAIALDSGADWKFWPGTKLPVRD